MYLLPPFHRRWVAALLFLLTGVSLDYAQNVTCYKYDNLHSGLNAHETVLTPANVNVANFGELFTDPVDGETFAQPLYLSQVTIPNKGTHNVVYVATNHDSVFAFDADTPGNPLWSRSFISPAKGITTVPQPDIISSDILPEIGIIGTPVIDPDTGTLYVVVKTKEAGRGDHHSHYVQKLHALDVTTGADKLSGPAVVADTTCDDPSNSGTHHFDYNLTLAPQTPGVKGTCGDGTNGMVYLNGLRANQRPSLILSHGLIYIGWSSHSDTLPYHGWMIGFDAKTLAPVPNDIWCATPDGEEGGIWQAGCGPALDNQGNLYISSANGDFDGNTRGRNWSQTFFKFFTGLGLSTANSQLGPNQTFDYFAPYNEKDLSDGDVDIGTGGMVVFDAPGTPYPRRVIGSGKEGIFYVMDRDNLGQFSPVVDRVLQKFEKPEGHEIMSTPVFFNNTLYYNRNGEQLRARLFVSGLFADAYVQTTDTFGGRGGGPVVSANGTKDGIVWLLKNEGPAHLEAFSAAALAAAPSRNPVPPLYDGTLPENGVKFTHPLVINGKVYAVSAKRRGSKITRAHLCVFGLLPAVKTTAKPEPPTQVTAASDSPDIIGLSWISHDPNVNGFIVERSPSNLENFAQVGTAGGTEVSYVDDTVTGGTSYRYRISAVNKNGHSDPCLPIPAKSHDYIAEDGLVGYWTFEEDGGQIIHDLTGHGHEGALKGEVSWSDGILDSSGLALHGTGNAPSRVEIQDHPDLDFSATQSFSLVVWARPSSLPGHWAGVLTKSRLASAGGYGLYLGPDNRWTFRGPDDKKNLSGGPVFQNSWHQIVAVQDGAAGTRTLYVNGIAVATGPSAQQSSCTDPLWLGQGMEKGEAFAGNIDEVRIYNRALTADNVKKLLGTYLPTVNLTAPVENATLLAGKDTRLIAATSSLGPDTAVTEVHFFDGANELGRGDGDPYGWTWRKAALGDHLITARAIDNNGNTVQSQVLHLKVVAPPQPPLSTPPAQPAQPSQPTAPTPVPVSPTAH